MMEELQKLVPGTPQFAHISDFFQQGTPDNVWIPQVAQEGWIVVSTDRGRNRPTYGGKLPVLCQESKITHILFSPKLHHCRAHEKVAALAMVWKEIEAIADAPPGSRFKLRFRVAKGGAKSVVLEKDEGTIDRGTT